jgi:hypothetical protein
MAAVRRRVRDPDGTRWWVGRRKLPWTPRRRLPAWAPTQALDIADGIDNGVVIAVVVGIVLLPITILLAVLLFEWLLVLLLLPAATFASAFVGRPWVVVARQGSGFPAQYIVRSQRLRFAHPVRGWHDSARAIAEARREIAETGTPRSLGEPSVLRAPRPRRIKRRVVVPPLDERSRTSGR